MARTPIPMRLGYTARASRRSRPLIVARGALGIALGAFELAKPRAVSRIDRLEGDARALVRAAGTHKLIAGAGMVATSDERPWLMLALAGAAFDAASLAPKRAKPSAFATLAALALVDATLLLNAPPQRRGLEAKAASSASPMEFTARDGNSAASAAFARP